MICPNCGRDNPSEFRFCGMCGRALPLPEAPASFVPQAHAGNSHNDAAAAEFADANPPAGESVGPSDERNPRPRYEAVGVEDPHSREELHQAGISGPSFLGLSEGPADDAYSYLTEDEPRRSHTGAYVFVMLLVIAAAVVALKWVPIRQYIANINKPPAGVYPNAADHSDPGLTADAKPPEHAPAPPQQPVAENPPADKSAADQPQMSVEEQKKQASSLPEHAVDEEPQTPEAKAEPNTATDIPETKPSPPPKAPSRDTAESASAASKRTPPAKPPQPKDERSTRLLTLGEKYLYGHGVRRSCDQAVVYLKAAANGGNAQARSHLGALYSAGECVPRDRVLAYHWFALAKQAEPRNPWLESNLNMLWRDMSSEERRRVGAER